MNNNRWFDLTPLLDVFLILLFVLLINRQIDLQQIESSYAAENEALMRQNIQLQLNLEQWERLEDVRGIDTLEERVKYDFLKNQSVVIDLVLQTEANQLWINESPTSIYLTNQPERRENQKNRIQQLLTQEWQNQGESGALLLVTLDADTETYRYAYQIMREAAEEWVRERSMSEAYVIQIR